MNWLDQMEARDPAYGAHDEDGHRLAYDGLDIGNEEEESPYHDPDYEDEDGEYDEEEEYPSTSPTNDE